MLLSAIKKYNKLAPEVLQINRGWTFLACRCDPRRPVISTKTDAAKVLTAGDYRVVVVANEFWALGPQRWPGASLENLFRWSRELCPTARLILNDYGIGNWVKWLGCPGAIGTVDWAARARDGGIPVTGIGIQVHLGVDQWTGGADLARLLARIQAVGLEAHLTEVTVWTRFACRDDRSWEDQARVYGEIGQISVEGGAVQFGLTAPWDGEPWCWDRQFQSIEQPGIFDLEGKPKPAFFALQKLGLNFAPIEG